MTVWGAVVGGIRRIVYSSKRTPKDITTAEVVFTSVNPMRHDTLLVVVKGDHIGTFVRRVTHEKNGASVLAVCRIVTQREGSPDIVTATTLKLAAEDVAIVIETKEEKSLNNGIMDEACGAVRRRR